MPVMVITVSSMGDWAIETFLLEPFDLRYLRTVTFILVIAAAVQFTGVELFTLTRNAPFGFPGELPVGMLNCVPDGASVMVELAAMNSVTVKEPKLPGRQ